MSRFLSPISRISVFCIFLAVEASADGPGGLWQIYFDAGVQATQAQNWKQAETLFNAAAKQADLDKSETRVTFSKYSIAVTYWERGDHDAAEKHFKPLTLDLPLKAFSQETRATVDSLTMLGNHFYSVGKARWEDATAKKLEGDALSQAQTDAVTKDRFARRYYSWALGIDKQFFGADSPELADPYGNLGLAEFQTGYNDEAANDLKETIRLWNVKANRVRKLSDASAEYSLLKSQSLGTPGKLNASYLIWVIGSAYYNKAVDLQKDHPAEAAGAFAQAELFFREHVPDPKDEKVLRSSLALTLREHAKGLRKTGQSATASNLEAEANRWNPPANAAKR